jgi:DNA polymerase III epsilon subunit-like protein
MKKLLFLLLFNFINLYGQNTGIVKGKIESTDGFPVSNLTIKQEKKGISIKHALAFLYLDLINYECNTFIAHNVEFDKNILLSECYRLDYQPIIEKLKGLKDYCTMKDNKIFNRWPKLGDLYEELFNKKIIIDHRSLSDVDVCHKCYCELMKMNDVNYIVLRNNKKIEKINLYID